MWIVSREMYPGGEKRGAECPSKINHCFLSFKNSVHNSQEKSKICKWSAPDVTGGLSLSLP